jgi:hypothetical protein
MVEKRPPGAATKQYREAFSGPGVVAATGEKSTGVIGFAEPDRAFCPQLWKVMWAI